VAAFYAFSKTLRALDANVASKLAESAAQRAAA